MSVPKLSIEFLPVSVSVTEPVTKFGGGPVWVAGPAWPNSRATGNPMRFICQIRVPPELFGVSNAVAYLFMTDEEEYVDGTWEPFGGENALIIQRGNACFPGTGPTLFKMVRKPGAARLVEEPCEFVVKLTPGTDSEFISENDRFEIPDNDKASYLDALTGNKVGGTPGFMQGDEFPSSEEWRLLLQLDSMAVPFSINFGDCGIGYAFVRPDLSEGRFLWQCA